MEALEFNADEVLAKHEHLRFRANSRQAPQEAFLKVDGKMIAAEGDMIVVTGAAKSGKSSVIGALVAGCILAKNDGIDTLGFEVAPNANKQAVVYFNTEMSRGDFEFRMDKILYRGGRLTMEPRNFYAYHLRSLDELERIQKTDELLNAIAARHNGIRFVVIDGIADYIPSVILDIDAKNIVKQVMGWMEKHKTTFSLVIHQNPGQDKIRGHLGSELMRKADVIIVLSKKGNDVTITTREERKAATITPITIVFEEDIEDYVYKGRSPFGSDKSPSEEVEEKIKAFFNEGEVKYTELVQKIQQTFGLGNDMARKKVALWKKLNLIKNQRKGAPYTFVPKSERNTDSLARINNTMYAISPSFT